MAKAPWSLGYDAGLASLKGHAVTNPYAEGSREREMWLLGFVDGVHTEEEDDEPRATYNQGAGCG